MNPHFETFILETMGAESLESSTVIQTLWSGYGEIVKVNLQGAAVDSIIIKYITVPESIRHPRGWNTNTSHKRKLKSYDIEANWYSNWSKSCTDACRVAKSYKSISHNNEHIILLEDLDAAGFSQRKTHLNLEEAKQCLKWLANFHVRFLGESPKDLWEIGTYWHLATRPDEFEAMKEGQLKECASLIDQKLSNCKFKTLVHGDAKVANFCFSDDGKRVAAVDFQYVGGGCGMKDVTYFMGSCLSEDECERWEQVILDFYFQALKEAFNLSGKSVDIALIESEWRSLYSMAWADFYRFVVGWMPTHKKINSYSTIQVEKALNDISSI